MAKFNVINFIHRDFAFLYLNLRGGFRELSHKKRAYVCVCVCAGSREDRLGTEHEENLFRFAHKWLSCWASECNARLNLKYNSFVPVREDSNLSNIWEYLS